MKNNLIICCAGDDSLHLQWYKDFRNYDLAVIYYGENDEKKNLYSNSCDIFKIDKGEKYHLIKRFINDNTSLVEKYDYIWLPDTDIVIDCQAVNLMFLIAKKYNLFICQPAMNGFVSHLITLPQNQNEIRFTSFVEILAPLFNKKTLWFLLDTFDENFTAHGLDFVWPKLLGYPENKIAIIDHLTMKHTKPVGTDYSRFQVSPIIELPEILEKYNLDINNLIIKNYSTLTIEI